MSGTPAANPAVTAGFIDAPARAEYYLMAVACFLVSFTNAHSTLLAVVFDREGFDLHSIGWLLSVIAAPVIGVALVSGVVMERLGALLTLRIAMVLIVVSFGSLDLTRDSFWPAIMSRIGQGAGQGLFLASAYTYVQSRLTQTRFLFLLGVFSATMPLAQAFAPPFGGYVLHRFGEGMLFPIATVPGLAGIALTFGLRPLGKPPIARGLRIFQGLPRGSWEPLLAVLMNGTLFGFCTAYLAAAMEARAIPLAAFFTASTVTMFASRLLALRQVENADRRKLVGLGLTLMSVAFIAVALTGATSWPVVFGGVTFGFGYSLTYPVISAWISEGVAPEARAGPQAVLNAFFNFGLFAMPLPETWLVASMGYERAMLVLAGLGFATAALLVARAAARGRSVHDGFN